MNYTFSHLPALPLHPTQIGTQQKQYEEAILRALNYKTANGKFSNYQLPTHGIKDFLVFLSQSKSAEESLSAPDLVTCWEKKQNDGPCLI